MSKYNQQARERFDSLLSTYQKICILLLFPPLMTTFSCFVGLFAPNYQMTLAMAFAFGVKQFAGEQGALIALIASLGVTAASVPLTIFGAKGKLWCYVLGMALIFADTVYLLFLFGSYETMRFVITMIIHVAFLGAYVVGLVFYLRADKYLKLHSKEILSQRKRK